jgi:DNA-binding NtrC family response regulator
MFKVLLVDDDPIMHDLFRDYVGMSYALYHAHNEKETQDILSKVAVDLIFLDIDLGKKENDGISILKKIKGNGNHGLVTMLTHVWQKKFIRESLSLGANDYLMKPIERDELNFYITKLEIRNKLEDENSRLKNKLMQESKKVEIIGKSRELQSILTKVEQLKGQKAHILLLGESGTGKELIARKLNEQEGDISRPFIAINCAALPKDLIESILFGHEAGAYTDAKEACPGKFELADRGDIFLDEITCLGEQLQAKLLRILEDKKVERIGSTISRPVEFRVIAATNEDPEDCIRQGKLREDLYYRLNTAELRLPALRERMDDLQLLVDYFMNGCTKTLSEEVIEVFYQYPWPGNIRELKQAIESAKIFSRGNTIELADIPSKLFKEQALGPDLESQMKAYERDIIERAVKTAGTMRKAAKILGVSPATICNKMKESAS